MSTRAGHALLAAAAIGLFLIAVLSVYVWGQRAFNVLMLGGLLGLCAAWVTSSGRWEDTQANVDDLAGRQDAVEAHLSGNEPLDYGAHASPEPPSYRSPTWPDTTAT